MKVALCIPGREVSTGVLANLMHWQKHTKHEIFLVTEWHPNIYTVREIIVNAVIDNAEAMKIDKMLWIDSDMFIAPSMMDAIIEDDRFDIVSGVYHMIRRAPDGSFLTTVQKTLDVEEHKKLGFFPPMTDKEIGNEPFECAAVGFGFICMKMKIFLTAREPSYFTPRVLGGIVLGEDHSFCDLMRSKGHKIMIDPAYRIGHEKLTLI